MSGALTGLRLPPTSLVHPVTNLYNLTQAFEDTFFQTVDVVVTHDSVWINEKIQSVHLVVTVIT